MRLRIKFQNNSLLLSLGLPSAVEEQLEDFSFADSVGKARNSSLKLFLNKTNEVAKEEEEAEVLLRIKY